MGRVEHCGSEDFTRRARESHVRSGVTPVSETVAIPHLGLSFRKGFILAQN